MRFIKRRKRTPRIDKFHRDNAELLGWARGYLTGRRSRQTEPRTLDAVVADLAKAYTQPPRLTARDIAYAGYLPTCPHCRQPLSEKDVRRFNIGLASNRRLSA